MMEKQPSIETKDKNFAEIENLIKSNDDVDLAFLDLQFDNGLINKEHHTDLSRQLLEKQELVESHLASIAKDLSVQVGELEIDPLTNFLTHYKVLEEKLNDLIEELNYRGDSHSRESHLASIMVIRLDLNDLKFFNDEYSHTVGDQALVAFASRLRNVTRRSDVLFRPKGGDEFIVLMPIENETKDFEEFFQKFRTKISQDLFITVEKDGKIFSITASAGYSVVKRGEFKTPTSLLEEADKGEREDDRRTKVERDSAD